MVRLHPTPVQLHHPPTLRHARRFRPADNRHHHAAPEVVLLRGGAQHPQPGQFLAQPLSFLTRRGRQQPRAAADTVMTGEPQPEVAYQFRMIQTATGQPLLRLRARQQALVVEADNLIQQRLTVIIQVGEFLAGRNRRGRQRRGGG